MINPLLQNTHAHINVVNKNILMYERKFHVVKNIHLPII